MLKIFLLSKCATPYFLTIICLLWPTTLLASDVTNPSLELSQAEKVWFRKNGQKIEVLLEPSSAPDMFINDQGEWDGVLIDYWRELEATLGYKLKSRSFTSWDQLLNYAKTHNNFIILGIIKTQKRSQYLSFTSPYTKVPYVLITHSDVNQASLESLDQKSLCSVKGFAVNDYLDELQLSYSLKRDTLEGLRAVVTGNCDIMVANQMYAAYLIHQQKLVNLAITKELGFDSRLAFAVSNNDHVLYNITNKALAKLSIEKRREINGAWLNPNNSQFLNHHNQIQWGTYVRWIGIFCLILVSIIGMMYLWSASLKRELKRQLSLNENTETVFRNYVENAPIGIFVLDHNGIIVKANTALTNISGYSLDELIDSHMLDLIASSRQINAAKNLKTLFQQGALSTKSIINHKDGSTKHLSLEMVALSNTQVLGFVIDMTSEIALAAEREQLGKAMAQTSDAVSIVDITGKILYVNSSFEKIFGYDAEVLKSSSIFRLKNSHNARSLYQNLGKRLFQGKAWQGRIIQERQSGETFVAETSISPIKNTAGQTETYVSVLRDISQQLRADEERAELEAQYHHAQKLDSVGRLAGGVAHDLNNLLIPILCYAELLQADNVMHGDRMDSAAQILKAGNRARKLVSSLLAYSSKQTLEFQTANLNDIINDMKPMLNTALGENVRLNIQHQSETPLVHADSGKVEQIIMNLCINAAAAMPQGGCVELATSQDQSEVCISIKDHGIGMDDATIARMFEPFFTTKGKLGTGLGLATVYGIVKQHQGRVVVDSAINEGTDIKIFLPQVLASQVQEQPSRPAATLVQHLDQAQKHNPQTPNNAEPSITILLAEDDEEVRHLISKILKTKGYRVLEADGGQPALQLAAQEQEDIQLLITDVVMPKMNGKDLYGRLCDKQPALKVIFISGYTADLIDESDLAKDEVNFIQKPFSLTDFGLKVESVLNNKL